MSKKLNLKAELRKRTGSGVLKQMRREGYIPAIIYGGTEDNDNIKVPTKVFTDLLAHSASANIVVTLDVEGKKRMAFIQDVQTDPMTGDIIHADFLAVDNKTEITAHIPLVLTGDPVGFKKGGVLEQQIHDIEITCLPNDLPETIETAIDHLDVGDILHISDLTLPKGVSATADGDILVGTVVIPRIVEAAESEEEGEEGAEAAAEEPAAAE
ncbi:MAG: 50S ribosomal protein L25 [Verrucomicrobiales bacterium]